MTTVYETTHKPAGSPRLRAGKPLLLVDQDGPMARYDAGFAELMRELHPHVPVAGPTVRTGHNLRPDYPVEFHDLVEAVVAHPGLYSRLEPVPGAKEAMEEIEDDLGWDVYICTSPLVASRTCVGEKWAWVDEHFGPRWLPKLVVTRDKTIVGGDGPTLLVDDKPRANGERVPTWTQVLFAGDSAPYNRDGAGYPADRILWDWKDWQEVLVPLMDRQSRGWTS